VRADVDETNRVVEEEEEEEEEEDGAESGLLLF